MKCALLENIHPLAIQSFKDCGLAVELIPSADTLQDSGSPKTFSAIGVRSSTQIRASLLQSLSPSLRVIGAFCIGTDQIDLIKAGQKGIPVFNAPYGNTRSVAELVISHIIALSRQSYRFNHDMHYQQKWHKTAKGSREVRGKTLGIVGYGHIGSQVSVLAESLGMKVLYFDIVETLTIGNAQPVKNLKELLKLSDFVTLHVPQTSETVNMIQKTELKGMKPTAFLINTSRGAVVNIKDLKSALTQGLLAGAAVDVFPEEPPKNQSPFISELQGLKQVILTPHIGGSTEEAQENIAKQVSSSLIRYLFHGVSEGAVNFPALNPPLLDSKRPGQRIVNIHKNQPGVLADINGLVSHLKINIQRQYLATNKDIGYLIMDVEEGPIEPLKQAIDKLKTSIRTHITPSLKNGLIVAGS